MQWFRMYAEFLTDPVVRMLAFEDQRHFVAVLCMKASGALDKEYPSPAIRRRALASLIGLSCENYDGKPVPFDEANRRLRELGLVDENWQPVNWDKRQFQSDSGAERMRKWRERHRDVAVTSPLRTRSDTDTDTEQKKNGEERAKRAPTAKRLPADFALTEERKRLGEKEGIDPEREFHRFTDHWLSASGASARKHDWDAAWRNWCRKAADYCVPRETVPTRNWRPTDEDSGTC